MLLLCYKRCGTCREVEKILSEKGLTAGSGYEYRHIDVDNPTYEELKLWHETSGLDIKRFFNTSGLVYRRLGLKDKLSSMSLDEKYTILSEDGLLVKRPILVLDDGVYVGADVKKRLESV